MSTIWGQRRPGEAFMTAHDDALGGECLVVGDPDWVETPIELGGEKLRVVRIYQHPCPCGTHEAKTFALEGTDLKSSECPAHGFLWWTPQRA